MAVEGISVAAASVTTTVWLLESALCVLEPSMTPDLTVIEHLVPAANSATAAENVIVAVAVPELLALPENVVLPHPDISGVASPDKLAPGSNTAMLSLACKIAFKENSNVTDEAVLTTGLPITSRLVSTAGILTAVDTSIAKGPKSDTLAKLMLTVR